MARDLFRIPLVAEPQTFEISLSGRAFNMTSRWNPEMPAWTICLQDAVTLEPLIVCLPMVTGVDLLSQFRHLGIPGSLFAYTEGDELAPPTLTNLGIEAQLYYLTDEA